MSDLAQWLNPLPLTSGWHRRLPRLPQVSRALQAVAGHHPAVVWPLSDVALRGTSKRGRGLIKPTLIGDEPR